MNVSQIDGVAGALFITDVFTEEEERSIWSEINYLSTKFKPPEVTGTALDLDGKAKKHNKGLFIHSFIYNSQHNSDIVRAFEKLYSEEAVNEFKQKSLPCRYMSCPHSIATLVNEFRPGDYYLSHTDVSTLTILGYFLTSKDNYSGGDLVFHDYGITITPVNNSVVIMPSYLEHEVTLLESSDPNFRRYSVAQFINLID